MESYLMMLYVTLEQESALKNFFVDQGWMFCKPDLSVTTDKLGPAVQNPPVVSEEISLPETDIPPQMKQTIPEIKINIPPSKPATGTSTVRRGKRKTKSPKQTAIRIKQAKVASASVPEPSESNENLVTEAVESNKSETLDTSKIKVPITVQVEDGNQFTIKIEQESEDVGNDKGEVDNSDVVGNDDFDDGDDDNDEETNVDYSFEGASTSEGDTSVKMESQSLGNNSTNVNTAAKGGSSGKHASEETENKENGWEYGYNYHGHEQLNFTSPADTSTEFTCLIEYFQELSEDQKRTVTGFLCVLGNALQACSIQRSTFASPSASTSSQQSSFASPMASTCKTNRNVLPEYEGKKRRQYKMTNLREAYNMVKELGVSVNKAAKIFDVPRSTLRDRVENRVSIDVTKNGTSPLLSADEEAKFTVHLMQLAEIGYVYTQVEISRQASDYAVVLGKREADNPFSTKWYKLYRKRQHECDRFITSRSNQKLTCVEEECIVKYYERLDKVIHEYNLENKPDNIYLLDEIDIEMDETVEECKTVTVIGAGSATGQVIPPYFIIVTGLQDEDSIFTRKSQLITKGFKNYLSSHFMKNVKRGDETEPIVLLYDGHKSHLSLDLIEWAKDNHIVLLVVPPHECCIVKTRNEGVFEPLKSQYNKEYNKLLKRNKQVEASVDVISVAKHVYDDVVNATALQSWFETTGIYPLQDGESMCGLLTSQDKLSLK